MTTMSAQQPAQHRPQFSDDEAPTPKVSKVWPITALIGAPTFWAGSIVWAIMAAQIDVLITPLGWTVIAGTTTAALLTFLGASGYWFAHVREHLCAVRRELRGLSRDIDAMREEIRQLDADLARFAQLGRANQNEVGKVRQQVAALPAQLERVLDAAYVDMVSATGGNVKKLPGTRK